MTVKLLSKEEIAVSRNLLSSPFPLINAVVNRMQEGKIFSLGPNFFIIHKAGFAYFVLNVPIDDYEAILDFFIQSKDLPGYFHVYDAPPGLQNAGTKSEFINVKSRPRMQLKHNAGQDVERSIDIPPGFYIQPITKNNLPLLADFNLDLTSKFWDSEQDFLLNGFGFCLFSLEAEPVSICYSACVTERIAEIDVATLLPFQQKGLGKAVVAAFIRYSFGKGITANWDCFEENIGSIKTALAVGFKTVLNYEFLSIFNKQRVI